ncbi:MAG: hypothetical protein ABI885_24015 [Gammaproteobacteria bacterium]
MAAKKISPASRPLKNSTLAALASEFEKALAAGDGVAGAHCIHERWMRGEFPVNIEAALEKLWAAAAKTIPDWLPMTYVSWLPLAYEAAAQFQPKAQPKSGGRSNIYLILLDYPDRRGDPHGAYVGMSKYSPAARFDQHKAGIRSAGCVLKRGIEVLTGPTLHLQYIRRGDAVRIEVEFAEALKDAGLKVEGGH